MAAVPKQPLLNAEIVIDGTDISNTANEVSWDDSAAGHDVTGFKGGDYTEETTGLKTAMVNVTIFQDRTAGGVHRVCAPLYQNREKFLIVVKADSDPIAEDNPAWAMVGLLHKYSPIGAKVGEPESQPLEIKNASPFGTRECVSELELTEFEEEVASLVGGSGSGSGSGE